MASCTSSASQFLHALTDEVTATRCKKEYSAYMQCLGNNECKSSGTKSECYMERLDMYSCFEKRTTPSQIEDIWGYKAFCSVAASCARQNEMQASFSFYDGKALQQFSYYSSDGCETEFENNLLIPYKSQLTACSQSFKDYLSCMTTSKKASCEIGSGNSECQSLAQASYACLEKLQ